MTDPADSAALPQNRDDTSLLGHPRALAFLFGTEMWERFSYYGMRSLLVLYMIEDLLKPDKAKSVLALGGLRSALDAVSGPLTDQAFASEIYGLYTGLVYLTPILGGFLADRAIGRSATVLLGAALMVAGHLLMASERLFLVALLLLIVGVGTFKPNVTSQVGELYAPGNERVDRAYSIFYVGINIGAFFSPLVCGFLGERVAWHYGFIAAGIGMAIGMAVYVLGLPHLPKPAVNSRTKEGEAARGQLRGALASLFLLFIPSALFWAAYEQQGNTLAVWLLESVDRHANLGVWQGEIPVTWFQAINPILIFLLTPVLVGFWARLARGGREPGTIGKMTTGLLLLALSYAVTAAVAWFSGAQPVHWLWLLLYFVIITISELYFSPIGLSLMSSIAPTGSRSTLMAIWFTSIFAGNILAGYLGSLWEIFSRPVFFLGIAALGVLAAIVMTATRPWLKNVDGHTKTSARSYTETPA